MKTPIELQGKGINLSAIGLSEVAWRYNEALLLIDYYKSNKIFILGGDVLTNNNGSYIHNYDSWHLNTDQGTYLDSIQKARKYITNYPEGDHAFVFVT